MFPRLPEELGVLMALCFRQNFLPENYGGIKNRPATEGQPENSPGGVSELEKAEIPIKVESDFHITFLTIKRNLHEQNRCKLCKQYNYS